jgi:nitroimidazol reductase NimA-like FMN-containing flavoprotein (pyridoxamine 5'-phosphate oxidase superfamily)
MDGTESQLSDAECIELLGRTNVARIALSRHALPVIEPVHYRLAGDLLVIAGEHPDSMVTSAAERHVVCFQTDGPFHDGDTRWFVQVTGLLDPEGEHHVLHLDTAMISGRVW